MGIALVKIAPSISAISVAFRAPTSPPETGASTDSTPRFPAASWISRASAGSLVVMSTRTLPLAAPGIMASAIFVFLESLDEFTGTFFVGVPQVTTLPLLLYSASMGGNYQIASITALILLVPSVLFMLFIERFLRADVLSKVGR